MAVDGWQWVLAAVLGMIHAAARMVTLVSATRHARVVRPTCDEGSVCLHKCVEEIDPAGGKVDDGMREGRVLFGVGVCEI